MAFDSNSGIVPVVGNGFLRLGGTTKASLPDDASTADCRNISSNVFRFVDNMDISTQRAGSVRIAGHEIRTPATESVTSNILSDLKSGLRRWSSMRVAWPAARPPHPFFKLAAHPFDMLLPCLIFFDGDGPADPLVAREWRYVFPCSPGLRVGRERFSEISGQVMYDSSGDSNRRHWVVSLDVGLHARPSSDRYLSQSHKSYMKFYAPTGLQLQKEAD